MFEDSLSKGSRTKGNPLSRRSEPPCQASVSVDGREWFCSGWGAFQLLAIMSGGPQGLVYNQLYDEEVELCLPETGAF